MADRMAEELVNRMMAKTPVWERALVWVFKRLPAGLGRRIVRQWGRDLIAWLDDAVRRRAPTQEVEAHLREIGMTEEQAAPFVAQHMANLHARKK